MRAESRRGRKLLGPALAWTWAACAASPPPPAEPSGPGPTAAPSAESPALEYLPLPHDSVFTYRGFIPESTSQEQLILQVDHAIPNRASLRSGNQIQRLVYDASGVRLASGGYLLRAPISKGASWSGPVGRVEVTGTDLDVAVAAGRFQGCVETVETSDRGALSRRVTSTYCPHVGLVRFRDESGDGERDFELSSFGPRVDVDAL